MMAGLTGIGLGLAAPMWGAWRLVDLVAVSTKWAAVHTHSKITLMMANR